MRSVRVPVHGTVASHVSCTTTDSADDVCCEVSLFRAVVLAVADSTTILTDLVLVVTEGTVQCSEFAKLVALVIVLTFWRRCSLHDECQGN